MTWHSAHNPLVASRQGEGRREEPVVWKPADIGVKPCQIGAAGRRTRLLKLFQPVREGKCEIVEGDSPEEAAVNLAVKLKGVKAL